MKQQARFLVPIATFIFICITDMCFRHIDNLAILFHSALFQSILIFFACFYNFSHKNKKSMQLRKHFSKRRKITITHCIAGLLITNLPYFNGSFTGWFFDPISSSIPIIFYARIENKSIHPHDPIYRIVVIGAGGFFFDLMSLALHFIIVYFICYQVLKIITQKKDVAINC